MYSYNPYYGQYLAHYGVLGMKWGVRKAKSYARDTNQHRRNQKVKSAKLSMNRGEITKEQYKSLKKQYNAEQKIANAQSYSQIKQEALAGKGDPAKKAADIYNKYKHQAYSEIDNYGFKRAARFGGKLAANAALSVALANIGFIPGYIRGLGKKYGMSNLNALTEASVSSRLMRDVITEAAAPKGIFIADSGLNFMASATGKNAVTKATLKAMGLAAAASAPVVTAAQAGSRTISKKTM